MRTEEEIKKAIDYYEKQKEELPEFNFFNENNWELIDAQLAVLKGEHFSVEDIYDEYEESLGEFRCKEVVDVYDWMHGDDIDIFGG